jgi:predicted dehydrogenase
MKAPFRWGIIGTGGIARAFAIDLQRAPDHLVKAVGSRSMPNGHAFASQFPDCAAYGSYEDLVADPAIDAVYVATPHPSHVSSTLLALRAGKPVLCEKPFAVNATQAKLMIDTARDLDLTLMEAMWTRFLPHIKKVREILSNETIGEIISVEADHGQRLTALQIPRLMSPEFAGGALLDLGIYPVSFAHMVLGVPARITASGAFTSEGVDSQTSTIFDYDSGAQAILTANMISQSPCRAVISGTLGRIEIDRTFYRPTSMRVVHNDDSFMLYTNEYVGQGLREEAIEFAELVRSGKKESSLLGLDETLRIMQSMDKIRELIGLTFPMDLSRRELNLPHRLDPPHSQVPPR